MKTKILLVEDDQRLLLLISQRFAKDYQVYPCSNTAAAMEVIGSEVFIDFLVTDFDLKSPDKTDGFDIANAFRKKYASSPIILTSGSSPILEARIEAILRLPHTFFLPKPGKLGALLELIDNLRAKGLSASTTAA